MKTTAYGAKGPAFLNVQPYFLLVGKDGGFTNADDFHKFASQEAGFTGVTVPLGAPFVDVHSALESQAYRDDYVAHFAALGLTLERFEAHVTMQNKSVAASRVKRFAHFVGLPPDTSVAKVQTEASRQFRQLVDVCVAFGFKELVGFPGGRGFPSAMAKWSAWPKDFGLWVLALLAHHWEADLEYAADRGVVVTFELGHPEEDLLSGANFKLFRQLLSKKARRACGLNADKSHFDMIGVDAMPHFRVSVEPVDAEDDPVVVTNHYKAGIVRKVAAGTDSTYGAWVNFGDASHTFATIGLACNKKQLHEYNAFNSQHAAVPVWEGECVIVQNPKQAMIIGAHNTRCIVNGDLDKLYRIPMASPDFGRVNASLGIAGPGGKSVALDPWGGGAFDSFAEGPVPAWSMLEMAPGELGGAIKIIERSGISCGTLGVARDAHHEMIV